MSKKINKQTKNCFLDMGFKPFLNCHFGYKDILASWEMTSLGHLKYLIKNNILRNDDYCIDAVINEDDEIDIKVLTCFEINESNGFHM